jgi:hypothetical protein
LTGDWGYPGRLAMYADMTLAEWIDMLTGEDPDDRAIREAHGIGYEEPYSPDVKCVNGCGLDYPDIASGKIRHCAAVP